MFSKRKVLGFGFVFVMVLALVVRLAYLPEGHVDEVHTIGRSLQMLYQNDLNPHFFNYPTGPIYFSLAADIAAFSAMSREMKAMTNQTNIDPLRAVQKLYPNPVYLGLFEDQSSKLWDTFRYHVRLVFLLFVPGIIGLLWYIGYRGEVLVPALAASVLFALSPTNIRDSSYVAVNTPASFFCVLATAFLACFAVRPSAIRIREWLLRVGVVSFVIGLAVACKYNAGAFLIMPLVVGWMAMWDLQTSRNFGLEKMVSGFVVSVLAMGLGFTVLCPYWFPEMSLFFRNVLYEVWHYRAEHGTYHSFQPGLFAGLQPYGWLKVVLMAGVFLTLNELWKRVIKQWTFGKKIVTLFVLLLLADQVFLNYHTAILHPDSMLRVSLQCVADNMSWFGLFLTVFSVYYLFRAEFFQTNHQIGRVLLPTWAGTVFYFLLMTNQALFFARNFSVMWASLFVCSTISWWFAAKVFAERNGVKSVACFQWAVVFAALAVCVVKVHWLDYTLGPEKPWWRDTTIVWEALRYWI
jgi:hypothetical protein